MEEYRIWKRLKVRDYHILANPNVTFDAKKAYFKDTVAQLAEEITRTAGFENLCAGTGDFSEICLYVVRKDDSNNEFVR